LNEGFDTADLNAIETSVLTIQWQSNYPFVTQLDNKRQTFGG